MPKNEHKVTAWYGTNPKAKDPSIRAVRKWWATCPCSWERWANEKLAAKRLADEHVDGAGEE